MLVYLVIDDTFAQQSLRDPRSSLTLYKLNSDAKVYFQPEQYQHIMPQFHWAKMWLSSPPPQVWRWPVSEPCVIRLTRVSANKPDHRPPISSDFHPTLTREWPHGGTSVARMPRHSPNARLTETKVSQHSSSGGRTVGLSFGGSIGVSG